VLSTASRYLALAGHSEEAITVGNQALSMAETFGLAEVQANALGNLSIAKRSVGDPTGDADLARSIEIARAANSVELGRALNNLAMLSLQAGDFTKAVALLEEAIAFEVGIGSTVYARFARGSLIGRLVDIGRWDDAMTAADRFIAESEVDPHYQEISARVARASMRVARGDVVGADADTVAAMALARRAKDPQALVPAMVSRVVVETILDHLDAASELRAEIRSVSADAAAQSHYIAAWWMAHEAGMSTDYLDELGRGETPFGRVAGALATGDLARAADVFASMGARSNEAYARLLAAERDLAAGDRQAGERQLALALAFYREVRATRFVERGEALTGVVTPEG
jgi:tetratricopeptide (TPR) repeat protein